MQNNDSFVIERIINAPDDLVWESLTDHNLLKKWLPFFPDFKAEIGFVTHFKLGRDEEHQYQHEVKVLEVVPHKKITYTWRYPDYQGNSHVTFELFPDGETTKVVLTHTITEEFPSDIPDFDRTNFAEGWTYTLDGLKKFVETIHANTTTGQEEVKK